MDSDSKHPSTGGDSVLQPYDLFMLLLCGYSLITLALETFIKVSDEDSKIIDAVENVVCGIFFIDFLIRFAYASNKRQFMTWGWIDLLACIPVYDVFRTGRVFRVIRILRLLRGIRVAKILAKYLQNNRADGTILFVIFVSILLLLISSVAILQVEKDINGANITDASDALWWSIVTMTTVGYGDKYPVTTVGRIIAAFLMIGGVGLFGLLSGSVTSWILNPVEERQETDLDAIQRELVAIHSRLNEVSSLHSAALDPQLARLIAAWPELSEPIRREIQRLVITNLR